MVSAFKKSGVFGGYDVVDDLDVILYANSLPYKHEVVDDTDDFKTYQAQYFTPSKLIDGLTRSRDNIANIEGILFDLDEVPDFLILRDLFYRMLIQSKVEAYLWKTPSSIFGGKHVNASRLYIPLREPIAPKLLSQAVDELVVVLKNVGIDVEKFGADLVSSKTIGRLMGLPLQQEGTIVPWDIDTRFKYQVKSVYIEPEFKPLILPTYDNEFITTENGDTDLIGFVINYTKKHGITWFKGERDDNLTRVIGAIKKAFPNMHDDEVYEAFDITGIASQLDNPEKDIRNKTKRLLRG
ncbi:hypothetical protein AB3K25_06525 [Leuconostoc sp. MS02]|uniref:Uncharacterized protein n=1 Tax=Leuconostoc aquikimchii TaxID=3236804 RepID=A0ABV3S265_9LACO